MGGDEINGSGSVLTCFFLSILQGPLLVFGSDV